MQNFIKRERENKSAPFLGQKVGFAEKKGRREKRS